MISFLFPLCCLVSEQDVMDVEKTYWALKGSGKFDLETFQQHVSPPLPPELLPGEGAWECMGWVPNGWCS